MFSENIEKKRVLIVDDHPMVIVGLKKILEDSGEFQVCGDADSSESALKAVEKLSPDLAIIDIKIKGIADGIDLVKAIAKRYRRVKSLVISVDRGTLYAERAVRAGAGGYISKEEANCAIVKAVRTVLEGKLYLSNEVSTAIAEKHINGIAGVKECTIDKLSKRELEIFRLLGKGFKRSEIAQKLNLNINTIESHRRKIREKLNLKDSAELTKLAVDTCSKM